MWSKERVLSMLGFVKDKVLFVIETNENTEVVKDYITSKNGMILFNSTCMCLQVIGETLKQIDNMEEGGWLKTRFPDMPWSSVFTLRNIISHDYAAIDYAEIYYIVKEDLPILSEQLEGIISDVEGM